MEAAFKALEAAAARARDRAVKWEVDAVEADPDDMDVDVDVDEKGLAFDTVLRDLGLRADRIQVLSRALCSKLGPDFLEQKEAAGCAKFVAYCKALLSTPAVPKSVPEVVSSVRWDAAFFSTITSTADKTHLLVKLDEYTKEWNSDGVKRWQAPFAAVVQSSGWGKSKTIYELWSSGVFVIYCSMSKVSSTGFPGRSIAAACFDNEPMSEALVCAYIVASLETLASSTLTPKSWIRSQIEEDEIGGEILARHKQVFPRLQKLESAELDDAVKHAVTHLQELRKWDLRTKGVQIVFAFDEGRGLPDFSLSFPVFRRGLGHLHPLSQVFVVLADTNASISNFTPHRSEDPTGRSRSHGQLLFDPIHLIGRADVFNQPPKCFRDNFELRRLFLKGRPLWGAHWWNNKHKDEELRVVDLVGFGAYKLVGGKNPGLVPTKLDAAALFMATIGPEVLSRSHLAHGLVAGHMATCVTTLDERRELVLVHTSEPVLAEASAFLMHKTEFLVRALQFLAEFLAQGLVLEGVRGELVMRLILLLCMHQCCSRGSNHFIVPVSVREFLQTLFGPDWKEEGSSKDHLDALVFFNHFVPLCEKVDYLSDERLQNFIRHGAAILYAPREFAADIGIPWVRLDEFGNVVETGVLEVQVKNRKSFLDGYEATDSSLKLRQRHKSRCESAEQPPVVIANLGDKGMEQMAQKGNVTCVLGFSASLYGFLPEDLVDVMKLVLAAEKDFTSEMTRAEMELMKGMAVLSFV